MEKKKKKTKYQPLDINMTVMKSTWAEEDDKDALPISDLSALREKLPTAPKAVRNAYDLSQLPSTGPWKAKLNNLPFNVREEEIIKFLGGETEVKNIDIPYNGTRMRGFAIAELVSREALANALTKTDDVIMGRRIPINLYTPEDSYNDHSGDGRNNWGRRDDNRRPVRDDDDGDWRSGANQTPAREEPIGRPDRSSPANGGDWSRNTRRPWQQDDDSRSNRRFDSRNNFDRYEGERDREPRRDWTRGNRDSDFRSERHDRPEREAPRDAWERRDPPESRERLGERREQPRSYEKPAEPPTVERPRLQLKPRSRPLDTNGTDSSRSSIFGGAKPVDTASKEREIETRLVKEGRLVTTGDFQRRRQTGSDAISEKDDGSVTGVPSQSGNARSFRSRKSSDSSSQGKGRGPSSNYRSDGEPLSPPIRSGSESDPYGDNSRRYPKGEVLSSNEDDHSSERNRRSSTTSGEQSVQIVDAPPPPVNIWAVRKSKMQKQTDEVSAPTHEYESNRSTAGSNTSNAAVPLSSASNRNVPSQVLTEKEINAPESSTTATNQSSNDEHKHVGSGDSATIEKDIEKEDRTANTPSQSHQLKRPPVVVSVSAAQRAAAEGQPPPPPIHENAWNNSQAAMDSVRRPPSPSRNIAGNHQPYSSERSYSYQGHHPHSGHNDWQDGQRMQRMDNSGYRDNSYRDNPGYRDNSFRGSGYRGGGGRPWRRNGGRGGGGYRGRGGRGSYRHGGDPNSSDM